MCSLTSRVTSLDGMQGSMKEKLSLIFYAASSLRILQSLHLIYFYVVAYLLLPLVFAVDAFLLKVSGSSSHGKGC